MANLQDTLKLRVRAKALGITGYKRMTADELRKAIGSANGNSTGTKTAAKTAVAKSVGRKTAGRKTASAKSAPVEKTTKRQTTGVKTGGWQPGSRGRIPASATKAQVAEHNRIKAEREAGRPRKTAAAAPKRAPKAAPAKAPAKSRVVKPANGGKDYHGGRNLIDDSAIDWTKEWPVGPNTTRGKIFKALKRAKGDTRKTFEALKDQATDFWTENRAGEKIKPDRALEILRWNISRVKFDFVMATGQHKPSKKFGTLGTTGKRAASKTARKAASKAAPKPAARRSASKSTRKAATPQKASQSRTGAKKPAARKSTARDRKLAGRK
jgi:hypothetical protein